MKTTQQNLRQDPFRITATIAIIWLMLMLVACAATPEFNMANVNKTITPKMASENINSYLEQKVLWGGIIINSKNFAQGTQFEVLAYPLDSNLKPQTDQPAMGRFIANSSQYLETLDYAQGRLLSVTGSLKETKTGKIGDADYVYPAISIEQLHLWKKQFEESAEPRVHFGVGVIFR